MRLMAEWLRLLRVFLYSKQLAMKKPWILLNPRLFWSRIRIVMLTKDEQVVHNYFLFLFLILSQASPHEHRTSPNSKE